METVDLFYDGVVKTVTLNSITHGEFVQEPANPDWTFQVRTVFHLPARHQPRKTLLLTSVGTTAPDPEDLLDVGWSACEYVLPAIQA